MTDQTTDHEDLADYTIQLYARVNGEEIEFGAVRGTYRPGQVDIGHAELANAFSEAAEQHRALAEKKAARRERHDRLKQMMLDRTNAEAPAEAHDCTGPSQLQVLYLPEEKVGEGFRYPFALVLSGVPAPNAAAHEVHAQLEEFAKRCGATAAIVTGYPVEVT